MKEHKLILLSADLRAVHARLARKFNAPLVEQEQHHLRNVENLVRGQNGAPDGGEGPESA